MENRKKKSKCRLKALQTAFVSPNAPSNPFYRTSNSKKPLFLFDLPHHPHVEKPFFEFRLSSINPETLISPVKMNFLFQFVICS
ncbi:hypothetical protein NEILACOT_04042 [Neisseria lactamica ATCC 23970]|uniref:Uncharacterized protein n=1 Tax=Neisseria lactamica ATCC 23970 TaxID=546265 RepID=D0W937_NEILA|nr:hypothetical protein NEILACOT_04042 [Neisseria lactamica ATCC 23970]